MIGNLTFCLSLKGIAKYCVSNSPLQRFTSTLSSVSEAPKMAASVGGDASVLGLSYQLASVDVSGRVVVWVVAEVTHPDPHGSETDFGEGGKGGGEGEGGGEEGGEGVEKECKRRTSKKEWSYTCPLQKWRVFWV